MKPKKGFAKEISQVERPARTEMTVPSYQMKKTMRKKAEMVVFDSYESWNGKFEVLPAVFV